MAQFSSVEVFRTIIMRLNDNGMRCECVRNDATRSVKRVFKNGETM